MMLAFLAVIGIMAVQSPTLPTGTKQQDPCVLEGKTSGQLVTLRGRYSSDPDNQMITPQGCAEPILLLYPWEPGNDLEDSSIGPRFRADKIHKLLERVTGKAKRGVGYVYDVEFTVTGRLDISDGEDLRRRFLLVELLGKGGFGSPIPFTRYRIVALWISDVFWWPKGTPRPSRQAK